MLLRPVLTALAQMWSLYLDINGVLITSTYSGLKEHDRLTTLAFINIQPSVSGNWKSVQSSVISSAIVVQSENL